MGKKKYSVIVKLSFELQVEIETEYDPQSEEFFIEAWEKTGYRYSNTDAEIVHVQERESQSVERTF